MLFGTPKRDEREEGASLGWADDGQSKTEGERGERVLPLALLPAPVCTLNMYIGREARFYTCSSLCCCYLQPDSRPATPGKKEKGTFHAGLAHNWEARGKKEGAEIHLKSLSFRPAEAPRRPAPNVGGEAGAKRVFHLNVIHFQVSYFYDRAQFTSRVGNQQGVRPAGVGPPGAVGSQTGTIFFYCV